MLRRNVLKQIETKATEFYNIYKKNFYFFLPLRTNKAKHQKKHVNQNTSNHSYINLTFMQQK